MFSKMQKIGVKEIDLKTWTEIEQQGIKAKKQTQKCNKPIDLKKWIEMTMKD